MPSTTRRYVACSGVNATKGRRFGDWEEELDGDEAVGEIYRMLQREYGRCISKLYRDNPDGPPLVVGWVFAKRMQYDDSREWYLREVWAEIREETVTVSYPFTWGSHPAYQ